MLLLRRDLKVSYSAYTLSELDDRHHFTKFNDMKVVYGIKNELINSQI